MTERASGRKVTCADCKRTGLTLDAGGLCHECWQDARQAASCVDCGAELCTDGTCFPCQEESR